MLRDATVVITGAARCLSSEVARLVQNQGAGVAMNVTQSLSEEVSTRELTSMRCCRMSCVFSYLNPLVTCTGH